MMAYDEVERPSHCDDPIAQLWRVPGIGFVQGLGKSLCSGLSAGTERRRTCCEKTAGDLVGAPC